LRLGSSSYALDPENQSTTTKPTKKDVDNLAKAVMDVITKAAVWNDDDQVVTAQITKRYATEGEVAHIRVEVELLDIC
jgi:Holliday junction resolvase RusA-like endonuclease